MFFPVMAQVPILSRRTAGGQIGDRWTVSTSSLLSYHIVGRQG